MGEELETPDAVESCDAEIAGCPVARSFGSSSCFSLPTDSSFAR